MIIFIATALLLVLAPPAAANDETLAHPRPVDESSDQRHLSRLLWGIPIYARSDDISKMDYDCQGHGEFAGCSAGVRAQQNLARRIAKAHRPDAIRGAVADLVRRVREDEHVAVNANLAVLAGPLFNATNATRGNGGVFDDSGNDNPVALASKTKIGKWEDCGEGWRLVNAATTSELKDCKERGCSITHSEEWNPLTDCEEAFIECACDDEESGPAGEDDEDPAEVIAP